MQVLILSFQPFSLALVIAQLALEPLPLLSLMDQRDPEPFPFLMDQLQLDPLIIPPIPLPDPDLLFQLDPAILRELQRKDLLDQMAAEVSLKIQALGRECQAMDLLDRYPKAIRIHCPKAIRIPPAPAPAKKKRYRPPIRLWR